MTGFRGLEFRLESIPSRPVATGLPTPDGVVHQQVKYLDLQVTEVSVGPLVRLAPLLALRWWQPGRHLAAESPGLLAQMVMVVGAAGRAVAAWQLTAQPSLLPQLLLQLLPRPGWG